MVSSAVVFLNEQLGLRQCSGTLVAGQQPCALLEMKKCLGPCVGAVSWEAYRSAVDEGLRLLRGDDGGLLERAAMKRDDLGEQMRFEEAADLRDRIRDVEHVVSVQRRLTAFAERNVVLVSPDKTAGRMRLLLVRAGRLIEDVSLPLKATPSHLRFVLRRVYISAKSAPQVSRDELDDLLILDSWIKRQHDNVHEVAVTLADLDAAAGALREVAAALADPIPA